MTSVLPYIISKTYIAIFALSPATNQRDRIPSLSINSSRRNVLAAKMMTLMMLLNIWSVIFTTGATRKPSPNLHSTTSRTLKEDKPCKSPKWTRTTTPRDPLVLIDHPHNVRIRCVILKGCRMGCSDKVSLWYVALLINTRFLFFILEYAIVKRI